MRAELINKVAVPVAVITALVATAAFAGGVGSDRLIGGGRIGPGAGIAGPADMGYRAGVPNAVDRLGRGDFSAKFGHRRHRFVPSHHYRRFYQPYYFGPYFAPPYVGLDFPVRTYRYEHGDGASASPDPYVGEVFSAPTVDADPGYPGLPAGAPADGWGRLESGDFTGARGLFAGRMQSDDPYAAVASAGYALAVALQGEHATGAWAMRRALRLDRQVLGKVEIGPNSRRRMEALVGRYTDAGETDAVLMRGALYYLLDDRVGVERELTASSAPGAQRDPDLEMLGDLLGDTAGGKAP